MWDSNPRMIFKVTNSLAGNPLKPLVQSSEVYKKLRPAFGESFEFQKNEI